ncbi:unnamed protein product, partial [Sphagnum compactum]
CKSCVSVRPVSYSLVQLRVMGITQCQGYPSVSGLFVRKTGVATLALGSRPRQRELQG